MKPVRRLRLDIVIAEQRMAELNPHGEEPTTLTGRFDGGGMMPMAYTADTMGRLRAPVLLDEVDWHEVAAIRLELPWGTPLDTAELMEEGGDWDEYGEPAPVAITGANNYVAPAAKP